MACDGGVVEQLDLLRRLTSEADGASVGEGCRFTVDRFAHTERSTVVTVEQSGLACAVLIAHRLSGAKNAQDGVVEAL